jgi:hypothetical protein
MLFQRTAITPLTSCLSPGVHFKGDLCAYCSIRPAITGDHIFARSFFVESARDRLPQAPICAECNNEKSELEHYLAAVLPFGGRHPDALENLVTLVPKRLRKNAALHRQLAEEPDENVPVESGQLEKLFALIARGLAWHHWKIYLNEGEHSVRAVVLTAVGALDPLFSQPARDCVSESIGGGTFCYEGRQGVDDPNLTIWRFSVYGGLLLSESGAPKPAGTSGIIAVVGPHELIEQLDRALHGRTARP